MTRRSTRSTIRWCDKSYQYGYRVPGTGTVWLCEGATRYRYGYRYSATLQVQVPGTGGLTRNLCRVPVAAAPLGFAPHPTGAPGLTAE